MSDSFGLPLGGQRLIVPRRSDRITGREIVIPRLGADPDALPASPSPWDDEFDQPSLGGHWSIFGSGGSPSVSTTYLSGNVTMIQNNSGGVAHQAYGVIRPIPPFPFTFITKITAFDGITSAASGNNSCFAVLATSSPGQLLTMGHWNFNSTSGPILFNWTNPTTIATTVVSGPASAGYGFHSPLWVKFVVTSTSNVSIYFSRDGLLYTPYSLAYNPGWTIAKAGVGMSAAQATTQTVHGSFDYCRFTTP